MPLWRIAHGSPMALASGEPMFALVLEIAFGDGTSLSAPPQHLTPHRACSLGILIIVFKVCGLATPARRRLVAGGA